MSVDNLTLIGEASRCCPLKYAQTKIDGNLLNVNLQSKNETSENIPEVRLLELENWDWWQRLLFSVRCFPPRCCKIFDAQLCESSASLVAKNERKKIPWNVFMPCMIHILHWRVYEWNMQVAINISHGSTPFTSHCVIKWMKNSKNMSEL